MSSDDARFWDERYAATDNVWSITPNVFVKEYCSTLPPGRAVDVAGGEGRNALWLASRGWEAENLDFSAVAIEKSLQRAYEIGVSDRFHGHVASALDAPGFLLAPVDLAVIAYLQLPVLELARAIAHTATQVRPGGVLFGVWHARENLTDGVGGPQNPAVLPTIDELSAAFSGANLVVRDLRLRERAVDGADRPAIDVVAVTAVPDVVACG